jgi:Homoserine acetyltransferase
MLNFPIISIRDLVTAHELLRLHLGIQKIDLLIGGSNGGFQAIEWAIQNPDIIDNLCLIATNAVVSPWCTAFNESQRLAIKSDKTFMQQHDINGGKSGLAAARSIALLSYRSYSGYQVTQQEQDENFFMAKRASSYQDYQGEKLVNRFDAYSYYFLSLGVDTHNVGRNRGGVKRALQSIKSKTLCIAIDSDILFPVEEMKIIAQNVPSATLEIISSSYGHDGFLLEYKQISESIKKHIKI